MKKTIVFTLVLAFISSLGYAQDFGLQKGDVAVSGNFAFGADKVGDLKTDQFEFSPSLGLMISDHVALGAGFKVGNLKKEVADEADIKLNNFSAGVFGRYYFTPKKRFTLFVQGELDYVRKKEKQGGNEINAKGFATALSGGMTFWMSKNFALEASLGVLSFERSKPDYSGAPVTKKTEFGAGLQDVKVGLIYKFNKG
ncbi:outer membrane beta-barrel protein [Sediminicola luteus]|uniref:Outer membrane protein beta-barrel domain-containing protein n=1 Tax=Sediminicola luteus TaxID=319238 RepID=A0A2A4G700_9FLAO|nr:outer membrane beta-barrel protein [Sediminicola luteus]PCE63750.1 hypothetical protein B7P33_10775 [Sediminicola luteus]